MSMGLARIQQVQRQHIAQRLLSKGFSPEEVAETIQLPVEEIRKFTN